MPDISINTPAILSYDVMVEGLNLLVTVASSTQANITCQEEQTEITMLIFAVNVVGRSNPATVNKSISFLGT